MSAPAPPLVLVDGRRVAAGRARVSAFDRGFQYGDALLETLRVDRGRVVALERHLQRLSASAATLGMALPERAAAQWEHDLTDLVRRNGLDDGEAWVRITLTRGAAARGLLPPAGCRPTVIVAAGGLDPAVLRLRRRGATAITLGFGRGAALAAHKHAFYLPAIEGRRQAAAAGADDGLFTGAHGGVECATSANVFAVLDEVLVTPRGGGVLPGVTRARALALARQWGWRAAERRLRRGELAAATEVLLTNALFEAVPVVRLDGRPVGDGRPGPRTRALQRALLDAAAGR